MRTSRLTNLRTLHNILSFRVLSAGRQNFSLQSMLGLIRTALAVLVFVTTFTAPAGAQSPRTGAEIYSANCSACHGADGKGAPKSDRKSVV